MRDHEVTRRHRCSHALTRERDPEGEPIGDAHDAVHDDDLLCPGHARPPYFVLQCCNMNIGERPGRRRDQGLSPRPPRGFRRRNPPPDPRRGDRADDRIGIPPGRDRRDRGAGRDEPTHRVPALRFEDRPLRSRCVERLVRRRDRASTRPASSPTRSLRCASFFERTAACSPRWATGSSAALDVARHEPDIAQILEVTYYGRRIDSLQHLAARLVDAGHIKPEWTHDQVVDALVVLTNVETFESLNQHRSRSWQEIADRLFDLTSAFRTA